MVKKLSKSMSLKRFFNFNWRCICEGGGGGINLTYSIASLCIVSTRDYDSLYVQLKFHTQNLDDIL